MNTAIHHTISYQNMGVASPEDAKTWAAHVERRLSQEYPSASISVRVDNEVTSSQTEIHGLDAQGCDGLHEFLKRLRDREFEIAFKRVAIFDMNAGYLQRMGESGQDASAVIYDLWKDAGGDVETFFADGVLCISVDPLQAASLEKWAGNGFKAGEYPEGLDSGVTHDKEEVNAILEGFGVEIRKSLDSMTS